MLKSDKYEVKYLKKTLSLLLSVLIVAGALLPAAPARAATMSSQAGVVTVSEGYLFVRAGASTGSAVVGRLYKGDRVTLLTKTGAWWQVEYGKGRYGYCHGDYIRGISAVPMSVKTQSGSLNVRTGPGTSYSVVGSLARGEVALVLSSSSGWSQVLYHGTKTGYVSSAYLAGTSSGYSAVSLAVPSFKQTDSRWAHVTLGSSGKTMAKIGCATTAIAMIESYRSGTTIYPDAMAKRLRYTSGGSVYWPSDYTAYTSSSGYLSRIYEQLRQGKPVLLGAKNGYGSQHWVVITGFTGGELTESAFTIHDPGSNSRTNLQQFRSVYPVFYKYFCFT